MHDEGPSGGQDTDFVLIDLDSSSPNSKLREIIQEQKAEIGTLNDKLRRAQWVNEYLEQRNKQLEDEQELIELQRIREDHVLAWKRHGNMTPFERKIWLEKVNIHLEKLLEKANRDKDMLRHMKHRYWARMHVCKAKMKYLKRRLSEALKR